MSPEGSIAGPRGSAGSGRESRGGYPEFIETADAGIPGDPTCKEAVTGLSPDGRPCGDKEAPAPTHGGRWKSPSKAAGLTDRMRAEESLAFHDFRRNNRKKDLPRMRRHPRQVLFCGVPPCGQAFRLRDAVRQKRPAPQASGWEERRTISSLLSTTFRMAVSGYRIRSSRMPVPSYPMR